MPGAGEWSNSGFVIRRSGFGFNTALTYHKEGIYILLEPQGFFFTFETQVMFSEKGQSPFPLLLDIDLCHAVDLCIKLLVVYSTITV